MGGDGLVSAPHEWSSVPGPGHRPSRTSWVCRRCGASFSVWYGGPRPRDDRMVAAADGRVALTCDERVVAGVQDS
jgi:hypothetical protein